MPLWKITSIGPWNNIRTPRKARNQRRRTHVLLNELAKVSDDRLYIRNEVPNVFFPGRDTAAVFTGNTIFLLARHPEIWKKLRTEVLALGDQKLTFELLKSMKYMQWVLSEGSSVQL